MWSVLIGDRQPVERLVQALQNPDVDVVRMAAEALGKIGDARAVDSLIVGLSNGDTENCVVRALGEYGDPRG